MATKAPSAHSGDISVLYREEDHFNLEVLHLHDPNVVSFQLALEGQRCYVVGLYLVPDKASAIKAVMAAIRQRPHGADLMLYGDFNANFTVPDENAQNKEIMSALSTAGLEYTSAHLLPRRKPLLRDRQKWIVLFRVQELCSQTNYILGIDCHLLQNVAVQDAWHNTYRYLVLG